MKIKSYKNVRITKDGSRYYAEAEELGKVQITPSNALDIFMSCNSFGGDIQNELYCLGTNSAHTVLYPKHHPCYLKHIQENVTDTDEFSQKYKSLEYGDVVMHIQTKLPMMFLGKFHYQVLENTKFYLDIHENQSQLPNSARANMFITGSGKIYVAPVKGSALKGVISFDTTASIDPIIGLLPESEVLELLETYCNSGELRFVDMLKHKHIEVVYVQKGSFKGEDLKSNKILQNYTLQELAEYNKCNRSRHFVKVEGNFMTLASVSVQTGNIFFGINGVEVHESLQKEKPLLLTFYL